MTRDFPVPPAQGEWMHVSPEDGLWVPDNPVVGFIEGDGVGPDIWAASRPVFDAAVSKAYHGQRHIHWWEIPAGEKASAAYGTPMPDESWEAIRKSCVTIKGPLTTPIGRGMRSLNVMLRQRLDLYACVRPVRYISGTPSPLLRPEHVDMVVFRENTEDVYAGIEWPSGSPDAGKIIGFLKDSFSIDLDPDSGIGIKPMSPRATKRLVRRALRYALDNGRQRLTIVHKGNIMKYTEGAFREWAYQVVKEEFPEHTVLETDLPPDHSGRLARGKILVNDRIADAMFQQVLLRPKEYDVLAMPNLNGDYLSDALAAQVGGLGMAPGANIGDTCAIFEATHGSAPKYAGMDKVNPGSMLLSGAMMLEHMGWQAAAKLVVSAVSEAIGSGVVTYDLARLMPGSKEVSCSGFGRAVIERIVEY